MFYLKVKMLPILNPFGKIKFYAFKLFSFLENSFKSNCIWILEINFKFYELDIWSLENSFKPINKLALREKLLKPFLEK